MALFGRDTELAELSALALEPDPDTRLILVTGAAGIGKSRLAREIRDAHVCALEEVRDREGVSDAIASTLGASDWDAVLHAVAERPCVLVLDDADHVLPAVREVASSILARSIDCAIVVTSRARLEMGERVIELGALAPEAALAMLEDRAQSRGAKIDDRALAMDLVRDLEGIPLAIELAAARVPVLGLRALVHRLRSRKDVLARSPGGRHGSLASAIDGSWQALDDDEKSALAQCAVFRGGFSAESAEAILESKKPVLDVLDSLLSKSLVRREGEGRLALYGPVRDFASEHLDPKTREIVREKHAEYFAAYAEKGDRAWLVRERENLLAVISGVVSGGPVTARRAAPALRALVCALPVLQGAAPRDAFDALIDPVLEATKASGVDALLFARVLAVRGTLRRQRGRAREGAEDLVRSLALVKTRGNDRVLAEVLRELGCALADADRAQEAHEHFERALALAQAQGDLVLQGRALASEAMLLHRALDLAQSSALLERAIVLHESDSILRAEDLHALGAVRVDQGRHSEAKRALEQALDLANGDRHLTSATIATLGLLHLDANDLVQARARLEEAASMFGDLGAAHAQGRTLGHLGITAHAEGRIAEAWALLSQAAVMLGETDPSSSVIFAAHLAVLDAHAGRAAHANTTLDALSQRVDRARMVVAAHAVDVARGNTNSAIDAVARSSALLRITTRCMQHAHEARNAAHEGALVLGSDGTWFRAPGQTRVGLERRRPLARMLVALGRARIESPGRALPSSELLAAGWPGEKVIEQAGAHRVRVGIATLRKLGLRDLLKTLPDGYALATEIPATFA